MERFKKYVLVALGFALAGAIGAAFGTGKAEAVVASLVQIANTTSSPVPTLGVDTARAPYQSSVSETGVCTVVNSACTFTFGTLPAGHRLFGDRLSGKVSFTAEPSIIYVEVDIGGAFHEAFFVGETSAVNFSVFDDPILFVLDSPSFVSVTVTLYGNGATFAAGGPQIVTLYGEDVQCSAVNCPPITTQ